MIVDAGGVYGQYFHYAGIIFFSGGAMLVFLYFWWKGKLGMDDEAMDQLMRNKDD